MKRFLLALATLAPAIASAGSGPLKIDDVMPTGLTKNQAKQVLIVVLKHARFNLSTPGMYIDDDLHGPNGEPNRPGYYDFSLSYDTPKAGATNYLGYYSVNVRSGDVWEVESCKRYGFPKLRALQRKLKKRTGTALADERIARDEVGCPPK